MRQTIAVLSTVTAAIAVTACSPSTTGVESKPTIAASAAATTHPDNSDSVCLGYRQQHEHLAGAFIDAVPGLDPSAGASQNQAASAEVKRAYERLRSWVDTQLADISDPQIKTAFEDYLTVLTQGLTDLQAAGHDGMKIMNIITGEQLDAAEEKILEVCKDRGLLPRPTTQ